MYAATLHRSQYNIIVVTITLLIVGLLSPFAQADLILTAPPRETPEAGKKVYQPLADYLSSFIGETVTYKHPSSWKTYEKNMKNDVYDIVFDGPHFAAWRINELRARPLIRLPGKLRFVLITHSTAGDVHESEDLIGRKICTLASPNLGALTLFSMFPYPVRQPYYHIVQGGFREVGNALLRGECEAAILRRAFYYKKAGVRFREQTKVLQHSSAMVNQGITVSKRISPTLHKKMVISLTLGSGKEAIKPILERFSNSSASFIPSTKEDYIDQNLLQDNIIFGW